MKKIINILIISTLIMLFPMFVKAYGISNYLINATLENNGDLTVQEYFELDGSYNGFERVIDYANLNLEDFNPNAEMFGGSNINNADGQELLEIRAVDKNPNFDFSNVTGDLFTKKDIVSNGEYGFYTEVNKINGCKYRIYLPSYKSKAFYLKYKLTNLAVMHNDVGEIFWNIVGNELTEHTNNLVAYISIPNNTNIRAWAHGPLNGNVEIIDNSKVKVSIDNLNKNTEVDVRVTFDTNVILNSDKKTNINALDKILKYEQQVADEANSKRQEEEQKKIDAANYSLYELENNLTKSNYDNAFYKVSQVSDGNEKEKLKTRLSKLKEKLDDKLYNDAKKLIKEADKTLSYESYKAASLALKDVDDKQKNNYLSKKLNKVYNKILQKEKNINNNYIFYYSLILLLFIVIIIILKKLTNKKIKGFYQNRYLRQIPNDIDLESVEYIISNEITKKTISAITLNLIHKDILNYKKINKKEIELTLQKDKISNLNDTEINLIDYMFNDKTTVNLKQLKKDTKYNYNLYLDKYEKIENSVFNTINKQEIFKQKNIKSTCKQPKYSSTLIMLGLFTILSLFIKQVLGMLMIIAIVLFVKTIIKMVKSFDWKLFITNIIGILLIVFGYYFSLSILSNNYVYVYGYYYMVIISLIIYVFCILLLKRQVYTENGYSKLSKLIALKNFLKDFGRLQDKEVIEVKLWEEYLIYAVALGCSKKLAKEINSKLDIEKIDNDLFNLYNNDFDLINMGVLWSIRRARSSFVMNRRLKTVGRVITAASVVMSGTESSRSSFSSRRSSASGRGGGFSSRGGSGGGGGGGSRF